MKVVLKFIRFFLCLVGGGVIVKHFFFNNLDIIEVIQVSAFIMVMFFIFNRKDISESD